jgi:hypothetical protein
MVREDQGIARQLEGMMWVCTLYFVL